MIQIQRYLPLIGFVVPTVAIGYGVVIPRSCIAGVNELTIGFGTTILGAAFTYIAGQRTVMSKSGSAKPSLLNRINRAINRQAAAPSGAFGRLLGFIWRREHARLSREVLDRLHLKAGQRVLEIGSGPGYALEEATRRVPGGYVLGLDISPLMVEVARARNRDTIERGVADVLASDLDSHDLSRNAFDRVFSVHCIYFWSDTERSLTKLAVALRPGGRLVLAFRPEGDDIPLRFRDPMYRFPLTREVCQVLERAGLTIERSSASMAAPSVMLVIAERPHAAVQDASSTQPLPH